MTKHTPTPWKVDQTPHHKLGWFITSDEIGGVATAQNNKLLSPDEIEANAEFIVRACNGWDNIEALKERIKDLEAQK